MIDKDFFGNALPGDGDADAQPLIALVEPDYVQEYKTVSFGGFIPCNTWWPGGFSSVPEFRENKNGKAWVITQVDTALGTHTWWKAISDPKAYKNPISQTTPYNGLPHSAPGLIEAEEFDYGGQGYAYHDHDVNGWVAPELRPLERVDLDWANSSSGKELVINKIEDQEWLNYTVEVKEEGDFVLKARVSPLNGSSRFCIMENENRLTTPVEIINAKVNEWFVVESTAFRLSKGQHTLKLFFEKGGFLLDNFEIVKNK